MHGAVVGEGACRIERHFEGLILHKGAATRKSAVIACDRMWRIGRIRPYDFRALGNSHGRRLERIFSIVLNDFDLHRLRRR